MSIICGYPIIGKGYIVPTGEIAVVGLIDDMINDDRSRSYVQPRLVEGMRFPRTPEGGRDATGFAERLFGDLERLFGGRRRQFAVHVMIVDEGWTIRQAYSRRRLLSEAEWVSDCPPTIGFPTPKITTLPSGVPSAA